MGMLWYLPVNAIALKPKIMLPSSAYPVLFCDRYLLILRLITQRVEKRLGSRYRPGIAVLSAVRKAV